MLQHPLIHEHERAITQIRYNTQGDLLFSVAKDNRPMVWYSDNGERLGTYNAWSHWSSMVCGRELYPMVAEKDQPHPLSAHVKRQRLCYLPHAAINIPRAAYGKLLGLPRSYLPRAAINIPRAAYGKFKPPGPAVVLLTARGN